MASGLQLLLYGLIGVVGSLAIGFILFSLLYFLYDWMKQKALKKNIPLDMSKMANPGKQQLSEKEVEEDERRKSAKFREFEKLRRHAERDKSGKQPNRAEQHIERNDPVEGYKSIPPQFDFGARAIKSKSQADARPIKKRVRLHRPADL